jgi:outer membrane protein assembly factor BamA
MRLLTAEYRYDTRNDKADPWTGWFLSGDIEHGSGRLRPVFAGDVERRVRYTRGFADLRRYNRLSPEAQVNMRLVIGGWLGGDDLPPHRRLSVGGAGTLPGFDFRGNSGAVDVAQCSNGAELPGTPALCERVALAQIEYRGALGFGRLGLGDLVPDWWSERGLKTPQWVAFADAGRGWLVGDRQGSLQYPSSTVVPALGTFRTDVGLGLDLRVIGFFVAKAVSDRNEPANFFVRVRHRF